LLIKAKSEARKGSFALFSAQEESYCPYFLLFHHPGDTSSSAADCIPFLKGAMQQD
jgi:hypothetical protein